MVRALFWPRLIRWKMSPTASDEKTMAEKTWRRTRRKGVQHSPK